MRLYTKRGIDKNKTVTKKERPAKEKSQKRQ